MSGILASLLSLVGGLVPLASGATSTVGMVIKTLTDVVPVVIKEYQDVAPFVKNIIAALKDDPAATQEQLNQLDALNKQVDNAFDAAAKRAEEEDKE